MIQLQAWEELFVWGGCARVDSMGLLACLLAFDNDERRLKAISSKLYGSRRREDNGSNKEEK